MEYRTVSSIPEGITCPDWQVEASDPKGRRCQHYAAGGECKHEVRILTLSSVCIEWEKAQQKRSLPVAQTPVTPSAASLIALPPAAQPVSRAESNGLTIEAPRVSAAAKAKAAFIGLETVERKRLGILDPPPFNAAKEISPESIEALEKAVEEIHLQSEEFGDVWLVRKKTDKDRMELTFREAATLRLIIDSFPGCRLVDLKQPEK